MSCITEVFFWYSFRMNARLEDMAAGEPLYQSVQRQMLEALSQGEWRPEEVIPSEKKLCERFGVSIGTLRKAIDGLVADHILIRHQGLGTFVAGHSRPRHFFQFFNVVAHDGEKTYPEVQLIQFSSTKADRLIAEKLQLEPGAPVFRIRNLLLLKRAPTIVDQICLPAAVFPSLTESMVRERPNTLYNLYHEAFGINVIRIDERVRAAKPPASTAKLLGLSADDPILEVRRIAYSFHRQPVEWRISHINTRDYEYVHANARDE